MNIMVFHVAAETGGALSVLQDYYDEVNMSNDKYSKYFFVISKPVLKETHNIKIMQFQWIKKSWFHRLYFDYYVAPRIIKKYEIDKVVSLQNIAIPRTKVPQTVVLHQCLPFIKKKFRLSENYLFWLYQNVISLLIINSIKKAETFIVPAIWIQKACAEKAGVNESKITVVSPKINLCVKKYFNPTIISMRTFFYPASGEEYKNHKLIVDAVMLLKEQQSNSDFKVVFTLNGDENKHITKLYRRIRESNLPIEFIGKITRDQVFEYYSRSVLIFPSYIETYGLPLLEAKLHNTQVIASDMPFSHEILDGYENALFIGVDDVRGLASLIKNKFTDDNK